MPPDERNHSYISDTDKFAPGESQYDARKREAGHEIDQLLRILERKEIWLSDLLLSKEALVLHVGSGYGAVTEELIVKGAGNIVDIDEDPRVGEMRKSHEPLKNVPIITAEVSQFFQSELVRNFGPFTSVIGLNVSADAIIPSLERLDTNLFSASAVALFTVWQPTETIDSGRIDDIGPVKDWIKKNQDIHPTLRFIVVELEDDSWQEKCAFLAVKRTPIRS